jgi:hypothetical protein
LRSKPKRLSLILEIRGAFGLSVLATLDYLKP